MNKVCLNNRNYYFVIYVYSLLCPSINYYKVHFRVIAATNSWKCKKMIIFIYKKVLSCEKNNDPISIFVSKSNRLHPNFNLHPDLNRCTTITNVIMSKNRVHPLLERLNAIITSSFPAATPSSSSNNGKKCGEFIPSSPFEEKPNCRSIDVNTGVIDCNGMSDFECEDFSSGF